MEGDEDAVGHVPDVTIQYHWSGRHLSIARTLSTKSVDLTYMYVAVLALSFKLRLKLKLVQFWWDWL